MDPMEDALAKTMKRACEPSPSCTRAEKAWASAIRQIFVMEQEGWH